MIIFGRLRDPRHFEIKKILAHLRITPTPLVVDVDQRRDHEVFIPVLARLLGTPELPQVLLQGEKLMSHTDILAADDDDTLIGTLQDAGLTVSRKRKIKGAKEWERLEVSAIS